MSNEQAILDKDKLIESLVADNQSLRSIIKLNEIRISELLEIIQRLELENGDIDFFSPTY